MIYIHMHICTPRRVEYSHLPERLLRGVCHAGDSVPPPLPAMWCLYIYEKEKEKHLDVWICLQFPNGIWQKSFAKGEVPVKKKMCSWKCFLPIRPCRALERLIMGWTRLFLVSQEYYSVEEGDDLIILSLLTGCIMRKSPGEWGP